MTKVKLSIILIISIAILASCGQIKLSENNIDIKELECQDVKFGSVEVGHSELKQLELKNNNTALEVQNINIKANSTTTNFSLVNPQSCKNIGADASCSLDFKFAPNTALAALSETYTLSYDLGSTNRSCTFKLKTNAVTIDYKSQLDNLLRGRPFDDSQIISFATHASTYGGHRFSIQNKRFNYEPVIGTYRRVNIHAISSSEFRIDNIGLPPAALPHNPYRVFTIPASPPAAINAFNAIDKLVKIEREYGMYSMKSLYTECYYAYAAQRLGPEPFEKLWALERDNDPRPLVFKDDQQWDDFRKDLKHLFDDFKGPDAKIVILGTSTTFFSRNPKKGKNTALFETPPTCITSAQDPVRTVDAYTYDTPGATKSDIDIHIFIPALSALCQAAGAGGNNGKRDVYYENQIGTCFFHSANLAIKNLVTVTGGNILNTAAPGSKFRAFFDKWWNPANPVLQNRDLNFSVHIRPDQLAAPLTNMGVVNFNADPYLKTRFVIPVN